jgi:hypothetical protein
MSEVQVLPQQFSGLTQCMEFALPTTKERLRKRTQSTMPQLQAFYDAMAPQMDTIMTYLMDFPAEESKLAPQELNLVRLAKAFMEVALAVELFKAPDEPHVWSFEDMVLEDR